jgi:hypothetical protein
MLDTYADMMYVFGFGQKKRKKGGSPRWASKYNSGGIQSPMQAGAGYISS